MCGGHFSHVFSSILAAAQPLEAASPIDMDIRTAPPPDWVSCPRCHAKVSAKFSWCPDCGARVKARPCAYCGQMVEPGNYNCLNCGAPVNRG